MDTSTLGAAIAIVKSIPGTAAARAEAAQEAAEAAEQAAEAAAELAVQHSYGVSVVGHTLVFSSNA